MSCERERWRMIDGEMEWREMEDEESERWGREADYIESWSLGVEMKGQ